MDENLTGLEDVSIQPDLSVLEDSIDRLVEIAEKESLERQEEKELLQAKEEQQQLELQKNDEKLLEDETLNMDFQENLLLMETTQTETSADLLTEMQTLNASTLTLIESTNKQNDLIVEGSFSVMLSIIIVASIQSFVSQITKW